MRGISVIGPSGTTELQLPESWAELSAVQFAAVAEARTMGADKDALKVHLFRILTGMPDAMFHRIELSDLLQVCTNDAHEEWAETCPFMNWLLDEPVLEKSMLSEVQHNGVTYQGPKSGLGNFTVLQFSFGDLCLSALKAEPGEKALNNLMGALHHEHGMLWDNDGIEARAEQLSSLPLATKLAAVLNYQGCRATLPLRYPKTFKAAGKDDAFGIDGLIESLAGEKFGEVDRVGSKPLHLALVHCERLIERQEEIERERKRQAQQQPRRRR